MGSFAPLKRDTFRNLAGFDWSDQPIERQTGYECEALLSPFKDENVLRRTCDAIELFAREPDYSAKKQILMSLDHNLQAFQRKSIGEKLSSSNFAPFYERLILAMQADDKPHFGSQLLSVGLNVARREKTASSASQDYFDWAVQYLSANLRDFSYHYSMAHSVDALAKFGELANTHLQLVTVKYVEMCCAFMGLSYLPTPIQPTKREQPHEITRRHRIASEVIATNTCITTAHTYATKNLHHIFNKFRGGAIKAAADSLFSEACIEITSVPTLIE